jgi:hypothetical protein
MEDIPVPATKKSRQLWRLFSFYAIAKTLKTKGFCGKNNSHGELDNPYVTG